MAEYIVKSSPSKFIYREAVLSAVGELFTICSESLPNELGHHYVVEEDIETFYNYVKDIPTADVRKNIKGEWIDSGSGQKCSVCGEFQPGYDNYRNFCSNCGADMRRDISSFTPEEQKTFWEAIEKKSIDTGVNIHDLI